MLKKPGNQDVYFMLEKYVEHVYIHRLWWRHTLLRHKISDEILREVLNEQWKALYM